MSKFAGTGPSSYKKRIYRAAVSQRLRNTVLGCYAVLMWWMVTDRSAFDFWVKQSSKCVMDCFALIMKARRSFETSVNSLPIDTA